MVRGSTEGEDQDRRCVMYLRLWLEMEGGLALGPGRVELLRRIERCGSLRKAAEELGISYRSAWGKIKRTEEILGFRLIETAGSYKEGYQLTREGRDLKEKYEQWQSEVEEYAMQKAQAIFAWGDIEREEDVPAKAVTPPQHL